MADPGASQGEALRNGGDAVVDVLEAAGAEVLFGIPSVHNLPIYDALARRGTPRPVTVRHEQAAAGAADGYSRISGRVGVFVTSTGPGAANAMGGLVEAQVSGSPVVHLTGQVESRYLGEGRGFIHEVPDQAAMLGSVCKSVLRPQSPEEIAALVEEALHRAADAPSGPVSVELPIDLQYAVISRKEKPFAPTTPSGEESPPHLQELIEAVAGARRPLIWAGGGAVRSGAEGQIESLARRIGAGVITTPNARGVISEDDPLCIGNLTWDPDVRDLLSRADLLLGIGTRYQGPNTENWKMELPRNLAQIDVAPEVPGRNYEPALAVRGDARSVLSALLDRLSDGPAASQDWLAEVAAVRQTARARLRATLGGQEALLDELSAAIGPETVVVKDATIPAYTWGNRLLPVRRTRTSVMPNGFGIGLGLPHALGAAVATTGRGGSGAPVVLMAGDGGFMLAATELATVAEEGLPLLVLLFVDGGYGILRNIQDKQYGRRIGVDLGHPDFCALSRSLGVEAEPVSSPSQFGKAVRWALDRGLPYLIEVDLSAMADMNRPYTGTSKPPPGAAG